MKNFEEMCLCELRLLEKFLYAPASPCLNGIFGE